MKRTYTYQGLYNASGWTCGTVLSFIGKKIGMDLINYEPSLLKDIDRLIYKSMKEILANYEKRKK